MRPLPLLPAASSPRRKAAPLPHVPTQRLRAMGAAALPAALHKTATGACTHTASCPEHLRGTAARLQGGMGTLCGPTGISASAHAACNTQPWGLAGLRRTVAGGRKGLRRKESHWGMLSAAVAMPSRERRPRSSARQASNTQDGCCRIYMPQQRYGLPKCADCYTEGADGLLNG